MRRVWFVVALMLVSWLLAASQTGREAKGEGRAKGKPITLLMVPKIKGIDYFNACEKGAREAAKELGSVRLIYEGPPEATMTIGWRFRSAKVFADFATALALIVVPTKIAVAFSQAKIRFAPVVEVKIARRPSKPCVCRISVGLLLKSKPSTFRLFRSPTSNASGICLLSSHACSTSETTQTSQTPRSKRVAKVALARNASTIIATAFNSFASSQPRSPTPM